MRGKIITIILGLIFLSSFFFYSIINERRSDYVKENGFYTEGTVITYGSLLTCSFYIDSIMYSKTIDEPYPDIVDGEKFKVYYHKKYSGIYYISFLEPIIDSSFLVTRCTNIIKKSKELIKFTYNINGKEYSKFQKVVNSEIKNINNFKVFYRKKNPRIAYIRKD
jgi:hypothetical protein